MHRALSLNIPSFGFIVVTRAALAFGAGLLMSEHLAPARRRALGRGLVVGGILTTLPAIALLRRQLRPRRSRRRSAPSGAHERNWLSNAVGRDERLIGVERFARKGDDPFADSSWIH